mmetsp:Transcript_21977/g.51115  ORF Transcript_21977/g.51115 Transcript_21977/m.51115 type:complete len:251 (+) Transcript_21977:610-1362(+)
MLTMPSSASRSLASWALAPSAMSSTSSMKKTGERKRMLHQSLCLILKMLSGARLIELEQRSGPAPVGTFSRVSTLSTSRKIFLLIARSSGTASTTRFACRMSASVSDTVMRVIASSAAPLGSRPLPSSSSREARTAARARSRVNVLRSYRITATLPLSASWPAISWPMRPAPMTTTLGPAAPTLGWTYGGSARGCNPAVASAAASAAAGAPLAADARLLRIRDSKFILDQVRAARCALRRVDQARVGRPK